MNVGSGEGSTLLSLAARVRALFAICPGVEILPARSAEVVRFVADVGRMRPDLGVDPPGDPLQDLAWLVAPHPRAA